VDPAAAIGTIDDLLDRFSGRVEKARRRWDLTTARGFARAVLAVALGLRGGERKQVARWRPSFSRAIRKNWPGMSAAQRDTALREIDGLVQSLGEQVASGQDVILDRFAEPIYSDARVSTIKRYGLAIAPSFSRIDFEAMESIVDLNVNFIRDREGAIADAYSVEARDIVSEGVSRGLGRRDISKNLATRFGDMRKPSYWDFIASHYTATGRTDSSLAAYSDAGVTVYKFSAVLDERTCFVAGTPIRMADGTTKPIERVRIGDLVRSISGRIRRVNRTTRTGCDRLCALTLLDGRALVGTIIHPVLTARGWVRMDELRRGDHVASPMKNFPQFADRRDTDAGLPWITPLHMGELEETAIVASVETVDETREVFDLTVEREPGYIAEGIVVHNSDVCRSFDGRTFSVADTRAMLAGARTAAEEDPNAIKEQNPFVYPKVDEKGVALQARQPDGKTTQVARIERSGVGIVGDRGAFTQTLSSSALLGKGIGPPPLHGFCRSTMVPLLG